MKDYTLVCKTLGEALGIGEVITESRRDIPTGYSSGRRGGLGRDCLTRFDFIRALFLWRIVVKENIAAKL